MAEIVLNDANISIGGADVSDHFMSATLSVNADLKEVKKFQSGWISRLGGLKDWSVTLNYNQDYDDNQIDEQLWGWLGTSQALLIRPDDAARSASNPEYMGNIVLESYSPLTGEVGELVEGSAVFQGNGTLSRLVT